MAGVLASSPAHAAAIAIPDPWTIVPPLLTIENDSFFRGPDRHYTSGLYASATSGRRDTCEWCRSVADTAMLPADETGAHYRYGFFFGQSMFTPENLYPSVPDPNDRPYAGWLFVGGRVYRESDRVLDRLQATLGVVGPASGADAVQRWWHALHWFGGVPPAGWHAQIKDEPGIVHSEQRIWRLALSRGALGAELLPEVNASLGNVFTYAGVGATLRVGQGLHADWGPPRVDPAQQGSDFVNFSELDGIAWYLFAGVEGRAVARNIFLDGNSFQHSANVEKRSFVADFNLGAAILFDPIAIHATYTLRSREFRSQDTSDRFYSFSLSYRY